MWQIYNVYKYEKQNMGKSDDWSNDESNYF
jgi:hypothetical protein